MLPAAACGCGAFIAENAQVTTETALVRIAGQRETIVMKLGVAGSTDEAAWLMPVPSQAQVALADPAVFDALESATAPRIEYVDRWGPTLPVVMAGAAPGDGTGGVEVREQLRLGPFDVVRLHAADSGAIAQWLNDNGFQFEDGVADSLQYYSVKGWEIVAAKLAGPSADQLTNGELPPLEISFGTDQPVYPMRLSRGADVAQRVQLYVLADHRYDVPANPDPAAAAELAFAGRVSGHPGLEPYLSDGTTFLTRYDQEFYEPGRIEGDYLLAVAATDQEFQRVEYVTRDRWPVTMTIIFAVMSVLVGTVVWVAWRSTRRRVAR